MVCSGGHPLRPKIKLILLIVPCGHTTVTITSTNSCQVDSRLRHTDSWQPGLPEIKVKGLGVQGFTYSKIFRDYVELCSHTAYTKNQ